MAFFKFRKGGGDTVATPTQSESVEAMRKRARQRLIGAAVLVLVGVIGFPLVFDTQPRPIAVDIPIDIPDRAKVKPLASPPAAVGHVSSAEAGAGTPPPAAPAAFAPVAPLAAPAEAKAAASDTAARSETRSAAASDAKPAASDAKAEAKADAKPDAKAEARHDAKADAKHEAKADAKHDTKAEAKADARHDAKDGDRAKALLEGKTPVAADDRFVIQVGAFSDATKAQAARKKLEKAGLKTYTHVAETKEGKRIRVRVGPFATRAEAEKAAGKVKGQDLPAAILTL